MNRLGDVTVGAVGESPSPMSSRNATDASTVTECSSPLPLRKGGRTGSTRTTDPDESVRTKRSPERRSVISMKGTTMMEDMQVHLTATYHEYWWEYDEDGDPIGDLPQEESGYTSVHNPWGGFQSEDPQEETMSLEEAAQVVLDFPGAVWDYRDDCDPSLNYRTGHYTTVTLHVNDHETAVFEIVDGIQDPRSA